MHEVRANWPAVRAGGAHQAGEEDGGSRGREQRRCRGRAHHTQLHWRPTHVPHQRLARVRSGVGGGGGASATDAAQGWRRRRRGRRNRRGGRGRCSLRGGRGRAGRGDRAVHRVPPQLRAPARRRGLAGAAGSHAASTATSLRTPFREPSYRRRTRWCSCCASTRRSRGAATRSTR